MRWLRTHLITPPLSAFCFLMFWVHGGVVSWFDPARTRVHSVARFWSWLLLRTAGVRILTRGLDRLPRDGCYVYVANHLSLADTPLMCASLPTPFRFLAKASLMRLPIIGHHLRRGGHIAVARDDARGAARSLADAARVLREKYASILVFAEGTRSAGELQTFKGGAAHLAIQCQAPIIPIAITGTNLVLPRRAKLLRPGRVSVFAGEPIATAGLGAADREDLTRRLQDAVALLRDQALAAIGRV